MRPQWKNPFRIADLESEWESIPTTPGVYIIMRGTSIQRVGGTDANGIIYAGKALNIRRRLNQFWSADHIASDLLRMQLPVACAVLGCKVSTEDKLYPILSRLFARIATPLKKHELDGAERMVLTAYLLQFGELPPLNFSMRSRWEDMPSKADLRWAEQGMEVTTGRRSIMKTRPGSNPFTTLRLPLNR
jgi:hypothetical protein